MTFDELKAKYAAMTPWPWEAKRLPNGEWFVEGSPLPPHLAFGTDILGDEDYETKEDDALGIVALHNAFPGLVERYEAMRVALEEAEWNQLDEHGNWMCPVCDRLRDDSRKHSPKCSIGLALALVAKPLTETGS